jgi:sugar lactone lactonase YvrE
LGIVAALTIVQVAYYRGLVGRPPEPLGKPAGGGGGEQESAVPPTGLSGVMVTTVAGGRGSGHRDGPAEAALFDGAVAVDVDGVGTAYIADSRNHCIRVVAPDGSTHTLAGAPGEAGFADGAAETARFRAPAGLALTADGSLLVADTGNHRIRRITRGGRVSTYAGSETSHDDLGRALGGRRDGSASQAQFAYPTGLAADSQGDVYVADAGNGRLCRISSGGEVTTVPTSGAASLDTPTDVTVAPDGRMWVADPGAGAIWLAAPGEPLTEWRPQEPDERPTSPAGLAASSGPGDEALIYIADSGGNCLWRLDGDEFVVVAGQQSPDGAGRADGPGDIARLSSPVGLAMGPEGDLYVADFGNNSLRRVQLAGDDQEAD